MHKVVLEMVTPGEVSATLWALNVVIAVFIICMVSLVVLGVDSVHLYLLIVVAVCLWGSIVYFDTARAQVHEE